MIKLKSSLIKEKKDWFLIRLEALGFFQSLGFVAFPNPCIFRISCYLSLCVAILGFQLNSGWYLNLVSFLCQNWLGCYFEFEVVWLLVLIIGHYSENVNSDPAVSCSFEQPIGLSKCVLGIWISDFVFWFSYVNAMN